MNSNYFWHDGSFYRQHKGIAMGAKYAPSVANIFLSKWEHEEIFGKPRINLQIYKRYIDDVIIVWIGMEEFEIIFGSN